MLSRYASATGENLGLRTRRSHRWMSRTSNVIAIEGACDVQVQTGCSPSLALDTVSEQGNPAE